MQLALGGHRPGGGNGAYILVSVQFQHSIIAPPCIVVGAGRGGWGNALQLVGVGHWHCNCYASPCPPPVVALPCSSRHLPMVWLQIILTVSQNCFPIASTVSLGRGVAHLCSPWPVRSVQFCCATRQPQVTRIHVGSIDSRFWLQRNQRCGDTRHQF